MAVAGAGAFGRNHLRVYRELESAGFGVALIAAVEPDAARAAHTSCQVRYSGLPYCRKSTRSRPETRCCFVAVPTVHHRAVALELLAAGLDLLVEKPLAANLNEADELIAQAEKNGRIIQAGHLERFNPAVLAVEPNCADPCTLRPIGSACLLRDPLTWTSCST